MEKVKVVSKIMIGGDGGVGKSTLLTKIITGSFIDNMKMTIGVDFKLYEREYENRHFTLALWDLGGEDQFRVMIEKYCRGAQLGIIAYDLTRPSSVFGIDEWAGIFHKKDLPLILIGTKADLEASIVVNDSDVEPYIEKYGFIYHKKVSSKNGTGIEDVVIKIIDIINESFNQYSK